MKIIPSGHDIITNMRSLFQINKADKSYLNEEPLRDEMFSAAQMKRFGRRLAESHQLCTVPAKDHLLQRLADNEKFLQEVRKMLSESVKNKYELTPASEWLVDNFYLIEEHIHLAKTHFPKNYSEALPQLVNEATGGQPRIYDIVVQVVSHSDGKIDIEGLNTFINSYQSHTNLKLGELWAIPIMLRIALIENIRRIASRMAMDGVDRNLADYWAHKMIGSGEHEPANQIVIIADMVRSKPPMVSAFVSELIHQLRGKGPELAIVLSWIEQQLAATGLTGEELVNAENQKQAENQVSISHSIGSLRLLSSMDWRDFVETNSTVEQTLRQDKKGVYGLMDFATRDRYRHVVESISHQSDLSELQIAQLVIELAAKNENVEDPRLEHVGYYLVDDGLAVTQKRANLHISWWQQIRGDFKNDSVPVYLACFFLVTSAITAFILLKVYTNISLSLLILIGSLAFLSASQTAISLVNFFATIFFKPKLLPKMDFSKGIPPSAKSMVVVPSMLNNLADVEDLVESLEVRYLANRNEHLHFALLTDFDDAAQETMPQDELLMHAVEAGIHELNKKYQRSKEDVFYLFHRPRKWNEQQKVWMGFERKRGKLSALNALLRGRGQDQFSLIVGDLSILSEVQYVITLDADTQLPLGSAWKMVGAMAHPLNHGWYDEKKKKVTRGYGILQPRVMVSLPDRDASRYALMHGNEPGTDPYTRASSDVYQDLFQEGSFIGKGIYNVDIFEQALDGRFKDNRILSHDLLEGCYARAGLLSDVQLFEKYPTTYLADMKRRFRWVRGDWQIFSWFLPLVPERDGWAKNPLSLLSRWKIFDNIRRSLIPISHTLILVLGWLVLPSTLFWTIAISAVLILPTIISSIWDAIRKPKDVILKYHFRNSLSTMAGNAVKTLFGLICLPYEAYANFRAIVLTLWRMFFSRKNLLEWNPSSSASKTVRRSLADYYKVTWFEWFCTAFVAIYMAIQSPDKLLIAGPILLLWAIAPYITWSISRPITKLAKLLSKEQNDFLQKLARKTWGFFEHFVTAEHHWLPPDNYQEKPVAQVANRTSPTNIGLSLLANLSACDFGFISTTQLLERTTNTFNTLHKLERYKGHFYNWYDTQTLQPLWPKYISTVDSGNLAGHLLVLRQGLLSISSQEIAGKRLLTGLRDTLMALEECRSKAEPDTLHDISVAVDELLETETLSPADLQNFSQHWIKNFETRLPLSAPGDEEANEWLQRLRNQLLDFGQQLDLCKPWLLLSEAPALYIHLQKANNPRTLGEMLAAALVLKGETEVLETAQTSVEDVTWLNGFKEALNNTIKEFRKMLTTATNLAENCSEMADMEWKFLYNETSHLLTIGYNVQEHVIDASYYDLLASEVRMCIFVCIAQGKLPEESWFALGRLLTNVEDNTILLSWSGSMFEYLMPLLVMPTYENTLLDQTNKSSVICQIAYGQKSNLPWGISESGYNMINTNMDYQYRAFGVPALALKRGMGEDAVIAPYASALALMVAPEEACQNLRNLHHIGATGQFGMYEAIDYTTARLPRGQNKAIIYSYMAHHQGMSLLSMAYLLQDKPMQQRFEAEPQFQAVLLLLQEKIPKATSFYAHTTNIADVNYVAGSSDLLVINTPNTPTPEVQLLSNGRYHVMVTNAGGGYIRWRDMAITRWRADGTSDNWGSFLYIKDLEDGAFWSNTYQPTLKTVERYEAAFSQGRADFHSFHQELEVRTEIVVSPEDDIDLRRIQLSNCSDRIRTLEITTYAEVVLASPESDLAAPAFSNLFVETEILPKQQSIICTRRPRSEGEQSPWMFHMMNMGSGRPLEVSYETNRAAFIGRANTLEHPQALLNTGPLSGTEGPVLDPVVAIRFKIELQPNEKVTLEVLTGAAESRVKCEELVNKYQDKAHKDRVFEMAWTHNQVVLHHINVSEKEAQLYRCLASSILFPNAAYRADPSILINNRRQQSGLWGYAISGDLPIVLLNIGKQDNMDLIVQLVQAHAFWKTRGLAVDLVIWNEEHNGYRQDFQDQINAMIPEEMKNQRGGIFVRNNDQIPDEDRILFQTVACIIISDANGSLADQIKQKPIAKRSIAEQVPDENWTPDLTPLSIPEGLIFNNGVGGFSKDGQEYVIVTDANTKTPAPWVNVLANAQFGTVISEGGTAYTWTENAHELRLTPWNNDPVRDTGGEAFYLRDEESGRFWSLSPLPAGGPLIYVTRHGFGYSVFEYLEDGIYSEMTIFVDVEEAVKFTKINVENRSGRPRKFSVLGYTEWVLGDNRTKTAMQIHTEVDPQSEALMAKNAYSMEFCERVAFFDVDYLEKSFTADRKEFIGRNGNLENPAAMLRPKLSGKTGLALDPCAAYQVPFFMEAEEKQEIIFRLGAGRDARAASETAIKFRGTEKANEALQKVKDYWQHTLSAIVIETPNVALNLITNGWLTYQTMSSRLWGRSGFYQSGGAFGFRDQLQDVLSLLPIVPELARKQILLCASRQFIEGDVQHWWHPPVGRGVRTRISDDYLWLPFVTSAYITYTGDKDILNQTEHFLEGRLLKPEEESYFDLPLISVTTASLYEHCVRAIKHGLNFGVHGLPLIGTGDWNDGLDKVGPEGKGESVWLGFFLYAILIDFIKVAELQQDATFAETCRNEASTLKENIDKHAWDGEWYKRAWFDDGKELGTYENEECRIDSIAQSWSVLSGAGDPDKVGIAMESAYKNLVDQDVGIIQLLTPAFDKTKLNPGYIKGYLPGVRENGGQYTHAATWLIMAFAKLKDNKRVWELLDMINPVNHGKTAEEIAVYKVEPYVLAADVYSRPPHAGRGGWTWYTGSAGWLYRLIVESILGLRMEGDTMIFHPCIPAEWPSFKVQYRHKNVVYPIEVTQESGAIRILVNEVLVAGDRLELGSGGDI